MFGLKLNDPSTLLLIVLIAVVAALLLKSSRYFARQKKRTDSADPWPGDTEFPQDDMPSHAEIPHAVVRWEVELHETARRLTAQLDSKMAALEALIVEADRAAARLEAASGPGNSTNEPRSAESIGTPLAPSPDAPRPSHRDEIYTLADYGYDAAEIARRVGSPIGEIELILSLRGRQ